MQEDLPPGPGDVQLGELSGRPFYIDAEQYERWGKPHFLIDVAQGAAEGFSLEGARRGSFRDGKFAHIETDGSV